MPITDDERPDKPVATRTANAVCLACNHEWCACEQSDWATLPCPACGQLTGRWIGIDDMPIMMKFEDMPEEGYAAYYDPPDWDRCNDAPMLVALDRLIAAQPEDVGA